MTKRLRNPDEGRTIQGLGLEMTRRVSGADTDGAFFSFEFELPPGEEVPPHIHHNEEEVVYVLSGEIESRVGDETVNAPAGSCHTIPRGTVHGQANPGGEPATLLITLSPSHLEAFFERMEELPPEEIPNVAEEEYGFEFVEE